MLYINLNLFVVINVVIKEYITFSHNFKGELELKQVEIEQYEMLKDYKDVLTIKDLKKILSIGKNKAYYLVNSDIIPSFKIDRQIRIKKESLINYLHSCE